MYIEATRSYSNFSNFRLTFDNFSFEGLTKDDMRLLRRELTETLRVANQMEKGKLLDAVRLSDTRGGKFKPLRDARPTIKVDFFVFVDDDEDDPEPTTFEMEIKLGRRVFTVEELTRDDMRLLRAEVVGILIP